MLEQAIDAGCGDARPFGRQEGIHIDGRRVIGMAKHLRDDRDLFTGVQKKRRKGVSHVVKSLATDASPLLSPDKGGPQASPLHRSAILRREHVSVIVRERAGGDAFSRLLSALGSERIQGELGEAEGPPAALRLDLRQFAPAVSALARLVVDASTRGVGLDGVDTLPSRGLRRVGLGR
jgi:hypothetical protein